MRTRQGVITSYSPTVDDCIVIDFNGKTTNKSPKCANIDIQATSLTAGVPIVIKVTGFDDEKDDLFINYTGLPAGAVPSPAPGTKVTPRCSRECRSYN